MIPFTTFITTPCVVIHNGEEISCNTYAYNVYKYSIFTDLPERLYLFVLRSIRFFNTSTCLLMSTILTGFILYLREEEDVL